MSTFDSREQHYGCMMSSPYPDKAYLACGISDGSISVVQVSQTLHEIPEHSGFIKDYESTVAYDVLIDKPCEASSKGITSLQWIQTAHPNVSLV